MYHYIYMEGEQLSTSDFHDILKASYLPQKKAAELMSTKGYSYDPELSSMTSKVFISPSGQPIISNRGSITAKDFLYEDVNAGLGGIFGKTEKVKQVQQLSKATQDKYGMAPTFASHSLGAYLNEQGAKKTPESQVYNYNKAAGLPSLFYERPKNQHDYRTTLDLPSALSAFQSGGSQKTLSGSYNPLEAHDIKYLT